MGGDTLERHGSLQVITVPVVTRSVEDIIMNIEGHASSVTDTECVYIIYSFKFKIDEC